jgi:DNA-binding transcriptional MerR regulator
VSVPGVPDDAPFYPIAVVVRATGTSAVRIRDWSRLGLLAPARTPGGHRLFSANDIERVRLIAWLLEGGVALRALRHITDKGGRLEDVAIRPKAFPSDNTGR